MAFSVIKSRPFRVFGLYKPCGKHAAPKGWAPEPHPADEPQVQAHRPAHAATMPRLTSPPAGPQQQADGGQQAA